MICIPLFSSVMPFPHAVTRESRVSYKPSVYSLEKIPVTTLKIILNVQAGIAASGSWLHVCDAKFGSLSIVDIFRMSRFVCRPSSTCYSRSGSHFSSWVRSYVCGLCRLLRLLYVYPLFNFHHPNCDVLECNLDLIQSMLLIMLPRTCVFFIHVTFAISLDCVEPEKYWWKHGDKDCNPGDFLVREHCCGFRWLGLEVLLKSDWLSW